MSSLTLDVSQWAEQQFGTCELGDKRRTKRLVKLATQVATKPDAATPEQTEKAHPAFQAVLSERPLGG
jgi:Transposase DNA-binding